MIVGAALLVGAVMTATQAHRPLRLVHSRCDPRVVIACWMLALAGVILTGTAAVMMLSHVGHGGFETLLDELGRCWATVEHGAAPTAEHAATLAGAALLLYLGSRLTLSVIRQIRTRRDRSDHVAGLLALAAVPASGNVHWIDHTQPMAFSVAGRPGLIAASRGLVDVLTPVGLKATLAHEQAHINGRHHLLVDIAEAAAIALPWAPLFRDAPHAIRELVELAADDTAADRHGAHHVAAALSTLATANAPSAGLAMADTAIHRRLARLAGPTRRHPRRRRLAYAAATLTIPLLPALLGAAILLGVGCA